MRKCSTIRKTDVISAKNADDLHVYRPGTKAVKELGVLSPLAELGITKAQVREIAADMGLSCASRPSSPCLATRLPYGTPISFELLERVDTGEQWMKELGFAYITLDAEGFRSGSMDVHIVK